MKQIEASAFRDCIALQEITLLSKDTTFETDTFRNCPGVVKRPEDPVEGVKRSGPMDLAEGGTVLKKYHGTDACVIVPAGVTAIAKECFVNCMSLQEIELPEGLEEIGKSAFEGCSSLKRIVIPEGVRSIREKTFCECTALQEIRLPDGLELIGRSAFSECEALQEIRLPDGLKEIGSDAFSGCRSLRQITVPVGVKCIETAVFSPAGLCRKSICRKDWNKSECLRLRTATP